MAHELSVRKSGFVEMAYVGQTPWHGLGQSLTEGASIEEWKKQAGMDWSISQAKVQFQSTKGALSTFDGNQVLFRSDTKQPLSIVSDDYKIVQPGEVLEFFKDLVGNAGMVLETAGVLFGGRRFWAMANTGRFGVVNKKDTIKGNLLLTTSCDGTLATNALFTSVRTVCNNTLRLALSSQNDGRVRVTHSSTFDPLKIKSQLGLMDQAWDTFMKQVNALSKIKMTDKAAGQFFYELFADPEKDVADQSFAVQRSVDELMNKFKNGMGADMSYGTAWGAANAVTEYASHSGRGGADQKLWGSFYGKKARFAEDAYATLLETVGV